MGKQRIIYLDLAKFLAITLVCVGHAYYFGDEMQSKVRPIIYSFHMSLFMTMCGFFSHSSFLLPFKNFVIKKSKQLLVPSVVGSLLLAAIAYSNGGGVRARTLWRRVVSKMPVCLLYSGVYK